MQKKFITNGPSIDSLLAAMKGKAHKRLTFEVDGKEREFQLVTMEKDRRADKELNQDYLVTVIFPRISPEAIVVEYHVGDRTGSFKESNATANRTVNPAEEHQKRPEGEPAEQVMKRKVLRAASGIR